MIYRPLDHPPTTIVYGTVSLFSLFCDTGLLHQVGPICQLRLLVREKRHRRLSSASQFSRTVAVRILDSFCLDDRIAPEREIGDELSAARSQSANVRHEIFPVGKPERPFAACGGGPRAASEPMLDGSQEHPGPADEPILGRKWKARKCQVSAYPIFLPSLI